MKIHCHCGEVIVDQTDSHPGKAHLIPDQDLFRIWDALDEVVDAVAEGRTSREEAYHAVRTLMGRSLRQLWQCSTCGRLYVDGHDSELQSFVPEGGRPDTQILRLR